MSEAGPQGFRKRSVGKTIGLAIITLGLYGLYWMYQLNQELKAETGKDFDPQMRTIGLLIPIYNFKVMWDLNQDLAEVLDQDGTTLFVMQLIPVVNLYWFYTVITEANKRASA